MSFKEKFLKIIEDTNYEQVAENKYVIHSELFGNLNVRLEEKGIYTIVDDIEKSHYVLLVCGGVPYTGVKNMKHSSERRRLYSFKYYLDYFLNAERLVPENTAIHKYALSK